MMRVGSSPQVLIAGAGPTGLVLALSLARRGVTIRIIDSAVGPGEHSRAMVVQARTLEFYRQLGFADQMIADGIVVKTIHLREATRSGPRELMRLQLGDMGAGVSPYPFALTYPQDDHERFLVARLAEIGVNVEWKTALTGFTQSGDGVKARIAGPNGDEEIVSQYLCGCDGAHSTVREALGFGFPGRTYEQPFFVCDCKVEGGFVRDLYANLGERALVLMFPVRSSGMQRLIGLVPPQFAHEENVTFETIRGIVEPLLGTTVSEVNWFAVYRVHHRVTEHFRSERVFILGDAAHIHSPAGGQGMNTGIGDAINLGWKLADALRERAAASVLDSFEQERIGFARALVATTDRAFTAIVAGGIIGDVVRRVVAPAIIVSATRFAAARRALFATVSQTKIAYPDSTLSEGKAGRVCGGDRLPWASGLDNFAPLRSLHWQLHVYGKAGDAVRAACASLGIGVESFQWCEDARSAGFAQDAGYLVRPDGHVALAFEGDDGSRVERYAARIGLRRRDGIAGS